MKMPYMYTRLLFLVFIAVLAMTSCKKDSSSTATLSGGTWTAGTPTFTTMVGTKTLTQYYIDVMGMNATQAQQYSSAVNLALMQAFTGTIQFKSDNTFTSNLGGKPDSGTWSLSADGKKLTVNSSTTAPETLDVTVLTSSKLSVKLMNTVSEDLNNDGTPETIIINVELPFTR